MDRIYHIAKAVDWNAAKTSGTYFPSGCSNSAFIHFSFRHQLLEVANRLFKGKEGLILLEVITISVRDDLKIEPAVNGYPHLYRALKADEVIEIHDFKPEKDGTFSLPENL